MTAAPAHSETGLLRDMPLRGARSYLKASDIFAALGEFSRETIVGNAYVSALELRRPAITRVAVRSDDSGAVGRFEIRGPGHVRTGWLCGTGEPILQRVAYDEQDILCQAQEAAGLVSLDVPVAGRSACDQAIILMKILAAQVAAGAWLFTSLRLKRPFAEQAALQVRMTDRILDRQIRALVIQQGQPIGQIRCVLKREIP